MTYYFFEDEWFANDADDVTDYTDEEEGYDDQESYYSDNEECPNDTADYCPVRQPVWKHVCVGGKTYMVSDRGCIRPENSLFQVSKGLEDNCSPYSTYTFVTSDNEARTYYMHDIVWQAFNGVPPDGWEVKHTENEVSRHKRHYSNALNRLTIAISRATPRPQAIFT